MHDFVRELVPVLVGAACSSIGWVIRKILQMQRDIDAAHTAIRELKKEK